ncbi:hypothetical protein EXIGLDRAFT_458234 [Exidia glandulosa HHB12029]|uniref:F-box domain-containing protein n=1 Tax=Exidia glandulosa HHB12029 TaxID=1314781 RepID=A0A166BMI4_EXIGL|nr:hypothetical protein EXIGLDRAFT_458234 [Exidia glandulosa HHB12029]
MSAFGPPPTEPLSVRRTKRTIVQVCSAWRDMATPFLYEYLAPENHSQAYGLYKLLQRRPQLGKFTRHIAFAVRAPYNDIEAHLFLVAHILLLVPFTQSVHFLFLSGLVPSKAPHILKGPRGQQWGWKSLHWVDTTLNDPRKLERMLNHCPALEELHLAGATVSAASRANTRLLLPQLRMLSVRDADDAVLEMVSGWTMPRLTHLSLALSSRERDDRLPRALLQQYGRTLKCLRIDGPGLSDGTITDLIAMCPNLEELISRAGIALPHKPMARLRKVGLLRSSAAGSAILAEHLRVYATLPALRTITVIEDARFALSAEDAARIFATNYDRLEFVDASGITIALPTSADRAQ